MQSVKKLKEIRGIRVLLSSWDEPRGVDAAYRQMDRALAYLQTIHDAVVAASSDGTSDPMEIAEKTAATLGLLPQVVTPLLARTLGTNMRVRDHKNLDFGT